MKKIKTYRELSKLLTFDERFKYLRLQGNVGGSTFGFARYVNQQFYTSIEWKRIRDAVLIRDSGCDLGVSGYEIFVKPVIHHINPITLEDLEASNELVFDLENLICTSYKTHNAIHYGVDSALSELPKQRRKGDMCPWKVYC